MDEKLFREGCVDIWIDELTPCLIDTLTGEKKDTIVYPIKDKRRLQQYREDNGWRIDWARLPEDREVYALSLKDSDEIQGLVAVKNDADAHACYIHWACTAPWNNKHDFGKQKYEGVGGHLFAIAVDKSIQYGYDGVVFGFASCKELLFRYVEKFGAFYLGILHPFHFFIDEESAHNIKEVYDYDWTEVLGK